MIGQLTGGYVTEYEGIMPAHDSCPTAPDPATAEGLITAALAPIRDDLDTALAAGDRESATEIAYTALAQVASTLAEQRGDRCAEGQSLVHALTVELEPIAQEWQHDGTLTQGGVRVRVAYRNWAVADEHVKGIRDQLASGWPQQWDAMWAVAAGGTP